MDDKRSNKHPADELARVRTEIKRLKNLEVGLRAELLDMAKAEREGENYWARVVERTQRKLNVEMLEDEIDDLSRFYERYNFVMIYLEKVKPE